MTSEECKRSLTLSRTTKKKIKRMRWRAPNAMYVTRRAIGAMNDLPSRQRSKLSGRKTTRSDGQVQIRKVGNIIPKLAKW